MKISLTATCLIALIALPAAMSAADKHGYYPYGWGWDNGDAASSWIGHPSPFWEGPYETYQPTMGKIKLKHFDKQDNVFLDGSYIGTVSHLKTIILRGGLHRLEIKHWGQNALYDKDVLKERISVVAGKTIKLRGGSNSQ